MTIDEVIEKEQKLHKDNQKVVDTHIIFEDVSIEEMYCDDIEVIEEHLENYQWCADYHKQVAEWLEELKIFKELYPDADIKGSLVTNYNNGWNDGIDELADGLCCQACFTNAQKDAIRKLAEEFRNEINRLY